MEVFTFTWKRRKDGSDDVVSTAGRGVRPVNTMWLAKAAWRQAETRILIPPLKRMDCLTHFLQVLKLRKQL